jgi:hypothetical protein
MMDWRWGTEQAPEPAWLTSRRVLVQRDTWKRLEVVGRPSALGFTGGSAPLEYHIKA